MKKCTAVFGNIVDKNQQVIDRAKKILEDNSKPPYQKKKAVERIVNWGRKDKQYSFELEKIIGDN